MVKKLFRVSKILALMVISLMASEKSIWIDSLTDLKNSTTKFCGTLKSLAVDSICSLNPEEPTALISCDPDGAFAISIEG